MIELLRVQKRGDWYYVHGAYNGKVTDAEIHAHYVDPPLGRGRGALERAVQLVAQAEGEKN